MNWFERGWYGEHRGTVWLWPLSLLYRLISCLRRVAYQQGWLKSHQVAVPVLVVGNISVGGTGKTPMTLYLCQQLQQAGLKVGIVSRGYGAKISSPVRVLPEHSPADVGDEPYLLARRSGCPVVVCPDRVAAAEFLLAQQPLDLIISDDGLQHYRLQRDIELVLVDGQRGVGNGLLLPAGPLREAAARLKTVDAVVINSATGPSQLCLPADLPCYAMRLQPATPVPLTASGVWTEQAVTLVAAIGNPERFAMTVQAMGIAVKAKTFFPDHFAFTPDSLAAVSGPVLMTEKDAVKCRTFAKADWFYLPVQAELEPQSGSPAFMPWLLQHLQPRS
ncbi:tetraacyldisaccharide 4'-kinase [Rheinheimera sp.]|uniref:tetraacyldisaccharide 4'-kinase n=1 Tax=Rheinheimera sp. TaxID=1869214 RepID=UPI00307EC481